MYPKYLTKPSDIHACLQQYNVLFFFVLLP